MSEPRNNLRIPAVIHVARLSSIVGSLVPYAVYLNGKQVGVLFDGGELTISTAIQENELDILDPAGHASPAPYRFCAMDGATVYASFRAGRFVLRQCHVSAPTLDERNARLAALGGK